ncbi:nitrate ABC transporter substrate-binding protein [Leptolyngbya sp. 'hensonii']|uniref:ABC transporter substrate-binding protein n=1 Tax=Leptolyngbya sp. 'hensonii' TaxID=1922337 RepID=UPI00094F91E9|nr:ABC transporter substrate-binding protein [Leptolyngbya sp. 'hensonii']OLP17674.1 nitrate ABC transporter substrate-binding protein [Leptolyngbya sp. 'hensonii']
MFSTQVESVISGLRQQFQFRFNVRRSLGFLLVLGFFVSLALHGCSGASNKTLQPLKVGITTWPGFDIVLYAEEAGLFKQRGLNVELVRFENQQDSSRAVMRGSLDAAFASLWDVVQIDPGNDKPVVLLVTNISAGSDGIVAQAPIKSVKDLRGKRVGAKLGTVNHLILLEALKLHGLKPEEVKIEDISNESAVQLMEEKRLDAAVIWQPLLGETAQKIKGNIVFTTKEVDSLVIDTFLSRSTLMASKKAEFTQFLGAWLDVMHAVETKPSEVFEKVGKRLNQEPAAFASDYAGLKKGDMAMQKRMFQSQSRLKEAMEQMGQLLQADPRAGRALRQDIEINGEPISTAIEQWKS